MKIIQNYANNFIAIQIIVDYDTKIVCPLFCKPTTECSHNKRSHDAKVEVLTKDCILHVASCFVNTLAVSFLLWSEKPFRRRKQAKHVVHKVNNMFLHFGWTHGANKVVFGPKYHWWKQTQIWIL